MHPTRTSLFLTVIALTLAACPEATPTPVDTPDTVTADLPPADSAGDADATLDAVGDAGKDTPDVAIDVVPSTEHTVTLTVTLDDVPWPDVGVVQGGTTRRWRTGADGTVVATVDMTLDADIALVASHPEARTLAAQIYRFSLPDSLGIALKRFDPSDNTEYVFQDPGEPTRRETTAQCAHCHVTINEAWFKSPHRTATSNPVVQDLYRGSAAAATDATACATLGGQWVLGQVPGSGDTAERCYVGDGVLTTLNGTCTPGADCEAKATQFAGCANCHAPAIDGVLGGRDLAAATGRAYDYGVHCDVCHKVDSVNLEAPAGVAGRLVITRPSQKGTISLGPFKPLTFGPHDDVPNPRMGNVPREHFQKADLCAGCHELDQAVLVAGAAIDTTRWPSGKLPVHTTYSEWAGSSFSPYAPCQSCHMPPDPLVVNGADLQIFTEASVGISGGWLRPPGTVRQHSWLGPKTADSKMLENAATLSLDTALIGGEVIATVTTKNVGPGHAIPTGEPLRHLILKVDAQCADGTLLPATAGDAVPDYGGAKASQDSAGDWTTWPTAVVGDRLRVIARPGAFHDYTGYGPFGDGTFNAAAKGLAAETVVGEVVITAVDGAGVVTTDGTVPGGDTVYLVGTEAEELAGAPGFGFARVMTGAQGQRMVPHFMAVDVASDNRLLPQQAWTTVHHFSATACADPVVTARLLHVTFPLRLARERGWARVISEMTKVVQ